MMTICVWVTFRIEWNKNALVTRPRKNDLFTIHTISRRDFFISLIECQLEHIFINFYTQNWIAFLIDDRKTVSLVSGKLKASLNLELKSSRQWLEW